MKVKISSKVLSISPYLSTSWKNISSLQISAKGLLLINLYDGTHVEIPEIDQASIDAIFEAHARYSDQNAVAPAKNPLNSPYSFSLPFGSDGNVSSVMTHNPEQANLAPLPPEVLQRIAAVTRALGLEDLSQLPPAEPHCNCMYCQVTRTLRETPTEKIEEIVLDEDLKFKNWEVKQTADKLYIVINPLDQNEQYNVFLGEPLGCTCGQKNCEHVRAVLNT